MSDRSDEPLIQARNLTKYYDASEGFIDSLLGRQQFVKAVDGVDLDLYEGETVGVVGESGCGKTTLGRALIQLVEPTDGSVTYKGEELTEAADSQLRDLRTEIQYIFQDPFSSLNPRLTVGDIIREPLKIHGIASGEERTDRIYELLETVGLNASHAHRYPHEFSGGQRQRIGIARALAVNPEVIVCDEPVSALDVSVQAQILNLLEDLQDEFDLSYLFIAHDLSVVEHISDRIGVMYLGEFAEVGTTEEIFTPPYHPYTEALLSAIPEPDPGWEDEQIRLSGTVPSPIDPPSGCRFHTRCPKVIQSEDVDIDQPVWRSLVDLKLRTRSAQTVEAVTATESSHREDRTIEDPADLPKDEFGTALRQEFDLPDRLSDPELERTIAAVIDRVHEEDFETARELLEGAIQSPCEKHDPQEVRSGDAHRIACLLYDDRFAEGTASSGTDDTAGARADD
jgi:peptide/nickel transport system ATP-binding protein